MPLAYIPSPPGSDIGIGPLRLHVYGALIVAGVVAAVWLADRRWRARGGQQGTFSAIAMWAVPGGLIGARLYHVVTDYELYTHDPVGALEIWKGGLGIWGGIAGGVLAGWIYIRRHALDFPAILDCVAPALPLAQAIGRWGNYFNQELFGRPTTLPWGLKVAPDKVASALQGFKHIPPSYLPAAAAAYQPTFLYESIWDLCVVGLLLLVERRVRLRRGYLFAAYVSLYTLGRFFTEYLRIDFAHKILGLRLNDWTSIVIFVVATTILLRRGVVRGGPDHADAEDPKPEPARVAVAAGQTGSTLSTTDLQGEIRPDSEVDPGSSDLEDSVVEDPVIADPVVEDPVPELPIVEFEVAVVEAQPAVAVAPAPEPVLFPERKADAEPQPEDAASPTSDSDSAPAGQKGVEPPA